MVIVAGIIAKHGLSGLLMVTVMAGGAFVASGVGAVYRGALSVAGAAGLGAGGAATTHREGMLGIPLPSSRSTASLASQPSPQVSVPSRTSEAVLIQVPPPSTNGNGSGAVKDNTHSEVKSA